MTHDGNRTLSDPHNTPPAQDLTTGRTKALGNSYFDEVVGWDLHTGSDASLELRDKCMKEEWKELREAIADGSRAEIAKECADVVWTVLAYAWGHGIPFDAVWDAVADSNYAKVGPNREIVRRADGKITKPPGWKKPDIEAILRAVAS